MHCISNFKHLICHTCPQSVLYTISSSVRSGQTFKQNFPSSDVMKHELTMRFYIKVPDDPDDIQDTKKPAKYNNKIKNLLRGAGTKILKHAG